MATHSSILAWKITWTEEPGRLQSMGSQRVGHDWASICICEYQNPGEVGRKCFPSYHKTRKIIVRFILWEFNRSFHAKQCMKRQRKTYLSKYLKNLKNKIDSSLRVTCAEWTKDAQIPTSKGTIQCVRANNRLAYTWGYKRNAND